VEKQGDVDEERGALGVVQPVRPAQPPRHVRANPLRRRLITGSAIAAASLAIGAGLGAALKPSTPETDHLPGTPPSVTTVPLVPSGPNNATIWHYVATVAQLGQGAIQFTTAGVVGYVILDAGGQVIAFSATCTHMGCIVQWKGDERVFRCPCHGGEFQENGRPVARREGQNYLASLPRLKVSVESGKIYVEVPRV
jgi:Rieske Fe-S protein